MATVRLGVFKYLVIYEAELNKVNGVEHMSGWQFFGEDEIHPYDREKSEDPYRWQRKTEQRTNRRKMAKNG